MKIPILRLRDKDGKEIVIPAIRGQQGPEGPEGPEGERGPRGQIGPEGPRGYTPVRGVDYWTPNDRAQMVSDVLAALPNAEEADF